MRKYELVCILNPVLEESVSTEALERVQGWIAESGGSVESTDVWGRRKLAHMINKQTEGHYVLMNITLDPKATRELERNIRFLEPVMRHMLTVL